MVERDRFCDQSAGRYGRSLNQNAVDALLRSANASDVFTSAIQTGKNAWEDNTALTNEASKRYETTASQLSIMKNNIYDVGITLGSAFLPKVSEAVQKVNEFCGKDKQV